MAKTSMLALLCIMLAYGCGQEPTRELTEEEKQVLAEEVRSRVLEYSDAWRALDEDRMLDFFADDEDFVFAGDGFPVAGYEEYTTQYRDILSNTKGVNYVEIEDVYINVLASDTASFAMNYRWSMVDLSGNETKAEGSWLWVLKKSEGRWRVVSSAGAHKYG